MLTELIINTGNKNMNSLTLRSHCTVVLIYQRNISIIFEPAQAALEADLWSRQENQPSNMPYRKDIFEDIINMDSQELYRNLNEFYCSVGLTIPIDSTT